MTKSKRKNLDKLQDELKTLEKIASTGTYKDSLAVHAKLREVDHLLYGPQVINYNYPTL